MGGRGWGWGGGSTWVSLELLLHVNRHLIFVCLLYNESLCNVSFVDFRVHRHRRAHGAGQVPSGLRPAISQLRSPAIFPNIFPLSSRRCLGGGGVSLTHTGHTLLGFIAAHLPFCLSLSCSQENHPRKASSNSFYWASSLNSSGT